jgi:hypothetical protein
METRIRRLPRPAVAGGLAVLAGGILWALGIEFERIWERAYEISPPQTEHEKSV